MMTADIYLASQSPRRRELLQQLGVRFEVRPADLPEQPRAGEAPAEFVQRMALEKAGFIWNGLTAAKRIPVLGADTIVCIDGQILGKPIDRRDGMAMLTRLSGRIHEVMTGVALVGQQHSVCVNVSKVRFKVLDSKEIERYWMTSEPGDKAGSYAIQGFAAAFIAEIQGSYTGVMGLPLFETAQLLQEQRIPIWQTQT